MEKSRDVLRPLRRGISVLLAAAALSGCAATDLLRSVQQKVDASQGSSGQPQNPQITTFSISVGIGLYAGVIDQGAGTISVAVPDGTAVTSLVAVFAASSSNVQVNGAVQTSGVTTGDFTTPLTYVVTASDGTTKSYAVTVTVVTSTLVDRPASSSRRWQSIASSLDGSKLVACVGGGSSTGDVYTSTDGGVSWIDRSGASLPSGKIWMSVSSSSDGLTLAAVAYTGDIYVSTNGGTSWTDVTGTTQPGRFWYAAALSGDGQHLAAVECLGVSSHSYVFVTPAPYSTASVWTPTCDTGSTYGFTAIASSSDGSRLVVAKSFMLGGNIMTGVNASGWTWTDQGTKGTGYWGALASSSDGMTIQAACNMNGDLYTLTLNAGGGSTWTDHAAPGSRVWSSISCSADASHIAATAFDGDVWVSSSGGTSWTDRFEAGARAWQAVAYSGDGTHLAAAVQGGDIYTGY